MRKELRERLQEQLVYLDWTTVWGNKLITCPNPNHRDSTPSCKVYPDHAYCFGCGWTWRLPWKFAQATWGKGLSLGTILRHLSGEMHRAPLTPEEHERLVPLPEDMVEMYEKKMTAGHYGLLYKQWGITPNAARSARIGFTGVALAIPHFSPKGELMNFKFRRMPGQKVESKYWSMKHRQFLDPYPATLIPWLYEHQPRLVLVEGEFDALALLSQKIPALAIVGATRDIRPWRELFELLPEIVLAFDMDDAGERARRSFRGNFADLTVTDWRWTEAKDIAELIAKGGSEWRNRIV